MREGPRGGVGRRAARQDPDRTGRGRCRYTTPVISIARMTIAPRLIVPDPDTASAYYQRALGAEEVFRAQDETGRVVTAALQVGDSAFTVSPAVSEWGWLSPADLGGSPVLIVAEFTDQDAVGQQMVEAGGEVVVPIENRPYGKREGRIRDPFGHLWIITGDLR